MIVHNQTFYRSHIQHLALGTFAQLAGIHHRDDLLGMLRQKPDNPHFRQTEIRESVFIVDSVNGKKGYVRVIPVSYTHLDVYKRQPYDRVPDADEIERRLKEDPTITHVAIVHCETTSGILNDIYAVAEVVKKCDKMLIVDAMSSFGGIEISVEETGIAFLISSANKCIQGVPGFSFVIARREALEKCAGKARSLSLDLYGQWADMEKDGKWRFTSPTHVVLAFAQALEELKAEGGVPARHARYDQNQRLLAENFRALGFVPYLDPAVQGPIITTFRYPAGARFTFQQMYEYIKARGYVLYPGKVMEAETFRVGNIGEIYPEDIAKLSAILADFLKEVAA